MVHDRREVKTVGTSNNASHNTYHQDQRATNMYISHLLVCLCSVWFFPHIFNNLLVGNGTTHSVWGFHTSINLRQLPQQAYLLAHQWRQSFIEILFPGDSRLCHWHLKVTVLYKWNYLLKLPARVLTIPKLLYTVGLVISVTLYRLFKLFLMTVKCLIEPS